MPYKDPNAARMAARERQRRYRTRRKAERDRAEVLAFPVELPPDPGEARTWAAATLKVPAGHPLAGQPMALPDFAENLLRAGWDAHESALCMTRKNTKSAICAVLVLSGMAVGR